MLSIHAAAQYGRTNAVVWHQKRLFTICTGAFSHITRHFFETLQHEITEDVKSLRFLQLQTPSQLHSLHNEVPPENTKAKHSIYTANKNKHK